MAGLTFADGRQNEGNGGGVYLTAGTVSNCVIRNSAIVGTFSSYYRGGGVYMSGGLLTHTRIAGTGTFNREADHHGGANGLALFVEGGRASNCLCTGDFDETQGKATRIAGNFVWVENGVIENCTIAGRTLRWDCLNGAHDKALRVETSGKAVNCVVSGFGFAAVEGSVPEGETPALVNDEHGTLANCYIDADAGVFRNFAQGDFRPRWGGALNDKGTLEGLVSVPAVDLVGKPRVINDVIDIGAYEARLPGTLLILR